MTLGLGLLIVAAGAVAAPAPPQMPAVERLQATRVSLLALLLDALESEGERYNLANEAAAAASFHSVRWNPQMRTLDWRFWVPGEGALFSKLKAMTRADAVALLKLKMKELAIFAGLEPMPGFDEPLGCLATIRVPCSGELSEEEWARARRELAAASVIQLAAPHAEGPILLVRFPSGEVVEKQFPPPASAPVGNPAAQSGRARP